MVLLFCMCSPHPLTLKPQASSLMLRPLCVCPPTSTPYTSKFDTLIIPITAAIISEQTMSSCGYIALGLGISGGALALQVPCLMVDAMQWLIQVWCIISAWRWRDALQISCGRGWHDFWWTSRSCVQHEFADLVRLDPSFFGHSFQADSWAPPRDHVRGAVPHDREPSGIT